MNNHTKFENKISLLTISSGSVEALKWIALLSMSIDHFNRFFLDSGNNLAYKAGRIAMPLFAFIFAYNLARTSPITSTIYLKSFKRLVLFGTLATPGYMVMQHLNFILPLNIMFMFLVSVSLFFLIDQKRRMDLTLAILLFLIGGLFVEYNWIGILLCLCCWVYLRSHSLFALLGWVVAYWLLDLANGNHWALLSLPLILLATQIEIKLPRIPYLFYIYYPFHLSLFWVVKVLFT